MLFVYFRVSKGTLWLYGTFISSVHKDEPFIVLKIRLETCCLRLAKRSLSTQRCCTEAE